MIRPKKSSLLQDKSEKKIKKSHLAANRLLHRSPDPQKVSNGTSLGVSVSKLDTTTLHGHYKENWALIPGSECMVTEYMFSGVCIPA